MSPGNCPFSSWQYDVAAVSPGLQSGHNAKSALGASGQRPAIAILLADDYLADIGKTVTGKHLCFEAAFPLSQIEESVGLRL